MSTRREGDIQEASSSRLWGRYPTYRVEAGCIVPGRPGSWQTSDPWGDYWRARGGRREEAPPYQSLIRLVHRARRDGRVVADQATVRAVTTWCGRHGLLGVLPAQVRELTVVHEVFQTVGEVSGSERITLRRFRLLQTSAGWETIEIDPRHVPAANYVRIVSLDGETREEDPGTTYTRFFPKTDDRALYLTPLSPAYWRAYGEPLDDFLDAGARLLGALEAAEQWQHESGEDGSGLLILRRLLGFATREPVLGDGRVTWTWTVPSLISAFAGMVLEDLAVGRRVLRCAECSAPFLTGAYQGRYCTATCRNTHLVRNRRSRVRRRETHTD